MKELLQRWAELEPSRCQPDEKSHFAGDKKVYYGGDWMQVWETSTPFSHADVQAAVQEAIEQRGWHYEQRWYGTIKVAYVFPPKVTQLIRQEADSHAEALLRAYLESLMLVQQAANLTSSGEIA